MVLFSVHNPYRSSRPVCSMRIVVPSCVMVTVIWLLGNSRMHVSASEKLIVHRSLRGAKAHQRMAAPSISTGSTYEPVMDPYINMHTSTSLDVSMRHPTPSPSPSPSPTLSASLIPSPNPSPTLSQFQTTTPTSRKVKFKHNGLLANTYLPSRQLELWDKDKKAWVIAVRDHTQDFRRRQQPKVTVRTSFAPTASTGHLAPNHTRYPHVRIANTNSAPAVAYPTTAAGSIHVGSSSSTTTDRHTTLTSVAKYAAARTATTIAQSSSVAQRVTRMHKKAGGGASQWQTRHSLLQLKAALPVVPQAMPTHSWLHLRADDEENLSTRIVGEREIILKWFDRSGCGHHMQPVDGAKIAATAAQPHLSTGYGDRPVVRFSSDPGRCPLHCVSSRKEAGNPKPCSLPPRFSLFAVIRSAVDDARSKHVRKYMHRFFGHQPNGQFRFRTPSASDTNGRPHMPSMHLLTDFDIPSSPSNTSRHHFQAKAGERRGREALPAMTLVSIRVRTCRAGSYGCLPATNGGGDGNQGLVEAVEGSVDALPLRSIAPSSWTNHGNNALRSALIAAAGASELTLGAAGRPKCADKESFAGDIAELIVYGARGALPARCHQDTSLATEGELGGWLTDIETRRVQLDLLDRWGGRGGALGHSQHIANLRMKSDRSWAAYFSQSMSTVPEESRKAQRGKPAEKPAKVVAQAKSLARNQAQRAHDEVHEASAKAIAREAWQQGNNGEQQQAVPHALTIQKTGHDHPLLQNRSANDARAAAQAIASALHPRARVPRRFTQYTEDKFTTVKSRADFTDSKHLPVNADALARLNALKAEAAEARARILARLAITQDGGKPAPLVGEQKHRHAGWKTVERPKHRQLVRHFAKPLPKRQHWLFDDSVAKERGRAPGSAAHYRYEAGYHRDIHGDHERQHVKHHEHSIVNEAAARERGRAHSHISRRRRSKEHGIRKRQHWVVNEAAARERGRAHHHRKHA